MRLFSDVSLRVTDPHLQRAVELALLARGRTAPNPAVGCVIVRDGVVVGEGFHARAGEPHAEVVALSAAGPLAVGSEVYVTLEPCRHHGRTGPCTDALIAAGVRRVTIGCPDTSGIAGGGAQALRSAGVGVRFAGDPVPFETLVEGWRTRSVAGRPFVTVKIALSLDGHPSFADDERALITGVAGARVTSALRDATDAVLVGRATVDADDPALTTRHEHGRLSERQPLRVILTRTSLPALTAQVLTDGAASTLVLTSDAVAPEMLDSLPADVRRARYAQGGGLTSALAVLGAEGINDLLVEAGPRLFSALWEADLIDRLVTVTAGGMAGAGSPALWRGPADEARETADDTVAPRALLHRLRPTDSAIVGDVIAVEWRRAAAGPGRARLHSSLAHDSSTSV